jgi:hypothetical protein
MLLATLLLEALLPAVTPVAGERLSAPEPEALPDPPPPQAVRTAARTGRPITHDAFFKEEAPCKSDKWPVTGTGDTRRWAHPDDAVVTIQLEPDNCLMRATGAAEVIFVGVRSLKIQDILLFAYRGSGLR